MKLQPPLSLVRALAFLAILALPVVSSRATNAVGSSGIVPNAVNGLDCNGWSPKYQSAKPGMKSLCTDPLVRDADGSVYRFTDNGHYVGHDEPSVKFVSSAPGSGNHMTYQMQLAKDPSGAPTTTATGTTTTDYGELSPAPWFGLPICDPNSYPQNPCTPDSDSNTGDGTPSDAGSAFMELQFYPPGYAPFQDAGSCDQTRYCAALNIDSLECNLNFVTCNPNCIEPVNFAYLQTDGVPTGPPSPQRLNPATSFAPNSKTLFMNQGDVLTVTIQDTPNGIKTTVQDLTTGQTGFMVASAANGFMNTDLTTCNGTPFSFHPEYSTAAVQNRVPWAALEGGVLMEDEIGHFEPCSSLTNPFPVSEPSFSDPNVFQTCVGGFENGTGEGPCTAIRCFHSTTINGHPCTKKDFFCEFSDAFCMPAGPRTVTINGVKQVFAWPVAGCEQDVFQNGDLDFDGSSYIADWPDGGSTHPTPFNYVGPFDALGNAYPQIQIETDGADEEQSCNFATGGGCTIPAAGAAFYPFWTLASPQTTHAQIANPSGQCVWNFGNAIAGQTTDSLGGAAEYGRPDVAWFAGTLISPVEANPALNSKC